MSMVKIQQELKVNKGQWNDFGKYHYRSCEDIVEAAKPLLSAHGYHLNMSDEIVAVTDRVYVKATATVLKGVEVIAISTAFAREPMDKKGMDASQITGTASSYARKYALNGLFAIDDTKDADTDEHQNQTSRPEPTKKTAQKDAPLAVEKPWYNDFDKHEDAMKQKINSGESTPDQIIASLRKTFAVSKETALKIQNLKSAY